MDLIGRGWCPCAKRLGGAPKPSTRCALSPVTWVSCGSFMLSLNQLRTWFVPRRARYWSPRFNRNQHRQAWGHLLLRRPRPHPCVLLLTLLWQERIHGWHMTLGNQVFPNCLQSSLLPLRPSCSWKMLSPAWNKACCPNFSRLFSLRWRRMSWRPSLTRWVVKQMPGSPSLRANFSTWITGKASWNSRLSRTVLRPKPSSPSSSIKSLLSLTLRQVRFLDFLPSRCKTLSVCLRRDSDWNEGGADSLIQGLVMLATFLSWLVALSLHCFFGLFSGLWLCHGPLYLVLVFGACSALGWCGLCALLDFGFCPCLSGPLRTLLCGGSRGLTTCPGAKRVGPRVCPVGFRFWPLRQFWTFLVWTLLVRVGEAAVPGPQSDGEWSLGIFNSAGLPGKAHLVPHTADCWVASETHLTKLGARSFVRSLQAAKSLYRLLTGFPVPPRNVGSELGAYSGVAFLSMTPIRRVAHGWDPVVYATSRLEIATFPVQDFWVTGIALYGTPTGPTQPRARQVTNELLSLAVERLKSCRGPAFVGGDINQDLCYLPAVSRLLEMGYVEVQDLQYRLTGQLPRPTCQHKTQRDFLWVSPQLAADFVSCEVDHDIWVDHSTLRAVFRGGRAQLDSWCWPMPPVLDWSKASPCRASAAFVDFAGSPDTSVPYRRLWENIETQVTTCFAKSPSAPGRAQCFAPVRVAVPAPHVRLGHSGDPSVPAVAQNWLHFHRFRQARRLKSYVRLVGVALSGDHAVHRSALWEAILRNPGYRPGFATWWAQQTSGLGLPALSVRPPEPAVASMVHQVVLDDCKSVARALQQHQTYVNKLRRKHDPNHVFRAVRRDAPKQVDVLVTSDHAVVSSVNSDTLEVVVDPPLPPVGDSPVFVAGRPIEVVAQCAESLWIGDTGQVEVGDAVVVRKYVGQVPEICEMFIEHWRQRWARHADVPWSHWQTILDFASRALPTVDVPPFNPSVADFRSAVSKKKKLAATGPDGVSREDAMNLTDAEVQSVLSLYRRAMTDGAWPSQMCEGAIRSLAKSEDPQGVRDFRPVTVYSFLYRVWSSMAARYWMAWLDPIFDCRVFGSRAGKRAAHMWREVLDQVDEAHQSGQCVAGAVFDLQAAFNLLPRLPALAFAQMVGVDRATLTGWGSFLSSNVRRFHVLGQVSGPVLSSCGFPEGCALSCLSMALVDEVYVRWLRHQVPDCVGLCYVDDWEVVGTSFSCISRAIQSTRDFARALDLVVDDSKSYCWASHRPLRTQLRSLGLSVKLDSRTLGAHVVYCRQIRNATVQRQLEALDDFWTKLSNAYGTYSQKCQAIRISGWPRVLHAISATILGAKHFVSLRSQAMQALGAQKPGANPKLHLALDTGYLDPELFAIAQTLRDHRALCAETRQLECLAVTASQALGSRSSVSSVLVQRVHHLGWAIDDGGSVRDRYGAFDLSGVSWQELDQRMRWAWHLVLSSSIAHRVDFSHFQRVDLAATRHLLLSMSSSDQGVYRKLLGGGFLTNQDAWRWSESGTSLCQFCQGEDSIPHRFWTCPVTLDLRNRLPPAILDLRNDLPRVCTEHGWVLQSSCVDMWRQALLSLPERVVSLVSLPAGVDQTLDFFTDGSCLWPERPAYRLASYSVILAGPVVLNPVASHASLVAAAAVPGLVQTAHRAELFAVAAVLEICLHQAVGGKIRIWLDCMSVVVKFQLLLSGQWKPSLSQPHSDLWQWVWNNVQMLGAGRLEVHKVPAHLDRHAVENDLLLWKVLHNFLADEAARVANTTRGDAFWRMWQEHADEVSRYEWLSAHLARFQVACLQRWFQEKPDLVMTQAGPPRERKQFPKFWSNPDLSAVGPRFRKAFGASLEARFIRWWRIVFDDQSDRLEWISFGQLLVHWLLVEKHPGVIKDGKVWRDGGHVANGCRQYKFRVRARWFRLMFQEFCKACGLKLGCASLKPHTDFQTCHVGCVSVPMREHAWNCVEDWFRGRVSRPLRLPELLDHLQLDLWILIV